MERVYLDHAATTPPDRRVLEAMWPVFSRDWGNPSSIYLEGQTANRWLDEARSRCARLLACEPGEIVFTSGGTESDNAAIRAPPWPSAIVVAATMSSRARSSTTLSSTPSSNSNARASAPPTCPSTPTAASTSPHSRRRSGPKRSCSP